MIAADPIRRWDVALAAEVERLRLAGSPGVDGEVPLTTDGRLRRAAVCALAARDPKAHEEFIRAFNELWPARPRKGTS